MSRVASVVAVAALLGGWVMGASSMPTAGVPGIQRASSPPTPAATHNDLIPAPQSAAAAKRTASDYALALYTDDLARMVKLATPGHAAQLAEPSASGRPATHRSQHLVRVVAVQTEDFRGGMALLQVLVERKLRDERPADAVDLQLVSLVLLRSDNGWRVDEASF